MLDTSIQVKTDRFDGPLGLLLLLIQKDDMDIRSLDLPAITSQYLNYLTKMKVLNFDVAGEYLYLASSLLLLKSKSCIKEDVDEKIDLDDKSGLSFTSEADLIKKLEELQKYQGLAQKLWALPRKGKDIFVKPKVNRKTIVNSILTPMDLEKLTIAMIELIQKNKRKYTVVKRDRLSIKEKLIFLKNYLKVGQSLLFKDLLEEDGENDGITNIIISFISLLELARLKKVKIFQNEEKKGLYVNVISSLEDFNVDTANGFEEEDENKDSANLDLEHENAEPIDCSTSLEVKKEDSLNAESVEINSERPSSEMLQ